jgi:hypothetical protein
MPQLPVHSRILNQAARQALAPLGVRQRGRSRLWFDDHGWWLIVVEFQPSSWSKGAYLNVGAMWLWQRTDHFIFNFGDRVESHREFKDEASFGADSETLAQRAATEVLRYRTMFPDITAVAKVLEGDERDSEWNHYHAAIASALAGRPKVAAGHLATLLARPAEWPWQEELRADVQELKAQLAQPDAFRAHLAGMVRETRAALKLPPWEGALPAAI